MKNGALTAAAFASLTKEYRWHCGLGLCAIDPAGAVTYNRTERPVLQGDRPGEAEARAHAVRETLRWGEATICPAPRGLLIWGVPLMYNRQLLGGILAAAPESSIVPESGAPELDGRRACVTLRQLVEKRNLTNADLLASRRQQYRQEQLRAEAIHALKLQPQYSLRATYLQEEPMLLAALRRGDIGDARMRINRLLAAMCYHAQGNLELSKSYFMELAITMCRQAVESGAVPEDLLGGNYRHVVELSRIHTEEDLSRWLNDTLEHILETMQRGTRPTAPVLIGSAMQYMAEHLAEPMTRDDVAAHCSMSPTHFSRMFRKHTGRSFVDMLNQMRVDRASEMLLHTDKELALVALETGFRDQSYFTKVFRRYTGDSPGNYRRTRKRLSAATGHPSG